MADVFKVIDVEPDKQNEINDINSMKDVQLENNNENDIILKRKKPSDNLKVDNFINDVKNGLNSVNINDKD